MNGKKRNIFRNLLFIFEAVLLVGTLVLLLLSEPLPQDGDGESLFPSLGHTPEPQERAVIVPADKSAGALVVLDASGLDDGGYFEQLADSINEAAGETGQYIKTDPEKLPEAYETLLSQGVKPTVVMGPEELVGGIAGLADISPVYDQIYFNEAADRCVTASTLPLALKMYGYYFRMDILHDMRVYVPRSYMKIPEEAALIAAKDAKLKAFAFEPGTAGSQLMLQQMAQQQDADVNDYIGMLSELRAKGLLLEDFTGGSDIGQAIYDGSAVMAFGSGDLYAKLIEDKAMRELVQVKPYLGHEKSYAASVISCAIVSGTGFETAKNYLVRLYREGADEVIIKRNPQYVNPGMAYSLDSPWSGVLTDGGALIILNENMAYSDALMAGFGYKTDSMDELK